ncbi:MAG: tail fiber domain-containing protein [Bacteroidales bacterium]|nr:tail fiber domain-containing protein [Bacteroidales bacterium]
MKNLFFILSFCFVTIQSWSQLRLNVDGDGAVSGNLTVNHLTGLGTYINSHSPFNIFSPGTVVLNLRSDNPLVEFRNNNNDYLAFIQAFNSDLYLANQHSDGRLLFRTSNIDRMTIAANGSVGIGTTLPSSKLTINGFENDGNIAGLEVRSGSQKLIMDGNEIDCASGGLHLNYNSENDLLVRTSNRRAEITVAHSNGSGLSNGFAIQHPGGNNVYWTLYSTNFDGNLEFYHKGTLKAEIASSNGAYIQISDRRLKHEIQPLESVLKRVESLNPSSYLFRDQISDRSNLGFIAQEVMPLFPELVYQGGIGDTEEEIFMLDYSGFGVIAIAAIQEMLAMEETQNTELMAENQKLQSQINSLVDRLDQLESKLLNCYQGESNLQENQSFNENEYLSEDRPHLAQNVPNPFRERTSIEYYLPEMVRNAEIFITDQHGKMIRSYPLKQTGYGTLTVETGNLPTGAYFYSLVIGGVVWNSLPMILAK